MSRTIVFGGWAISPRILEPVFGRDATYVDVNVIMEDIIDRETLLADWADRVISSLGIDIKDIGMIAGWSAGAMFAFAVGKIVPPKAMVLLSATPHFCRTTDFPFGTRSSTLDKMIDALIADKEKVLTDFLLRSGVTSPLSDIGGYSLSALKKGLLFLKQASLFPVEPVPVPTLFFHGREDLIIPREAGIYFSGKAGGVYCGEEGGHAFFLKSPEYIAKSIETALYHFNNLA
jgi:pimeloyl-ACP methyl ester carboxylesterase